MSWLTKKNFSFISIYSMQDCDRALWRMYTEQDDIRLLTSNISNGVHRYRLARRISKGRNALAYAEADIEISPISGGVQVSGYAKISILQILFYVYFVVASILFAYILRNVLPVVLLLYFLLFTFISIWWLRLVFINRRHFVFIIEQTLGIA